MMLCARPIPASVNPALTTLGWAPEATMATMRLADKATVVASHAHRVSGADIEKKTVINEQHQYDAETIPDFRPLVLAG